VFQQLDFFNKISNKLLMFENTYIDV